MTDENFRRVLLTGATGFLGSHLARLLVKEGHQVFAVVRADSDRWRLADVERDLCVIEGDLSDLPTIRDALRDARADVCLHLAWRGWSGKAEAEENLSALGVSLDLLRAMPDIACRRFVAVGTCFEYDLDRDPLTESTPLRPRELYGTCKKSLYEVAQQFSTLTGVSVVTPRVFYSYGPYEDTRRLVPSITLSLLRGEPAKVTRGEQVRDYLHAEDVVSAIWRVATSDRTGAVNIASGKPVTIAELAVRLGRLMERPDLVQLGALPYRPGEAMRIVGDAGTLTELKWTPRFDLDEGLAKTVDWWRTRKGSV